LLLLIFFKFGNLPSEVVLTVKATQGESESET